MTTIDFSRIRSTPKSRNDSFEALAVQLFRASCAFPTGATFYSLRGDGGDGGVEGYFRTPSGEVLGVQAKYFFKLDASELRQMANSLETALLNHPTLSQYWIYVPFDPTGRKGAGKRGKGEVERFDEWKVAAESAARRRGRKLTIILCSASTIRDQFQRTDTHGGLRRYWFDDAVLTSAQISRCLDQAKAFAGPRYTEGLDVVTNAHQALDFFGGIGDFNAWRESAWAPLLTQFRWLVERSQEVFGVLPDQQRDEAVRLFTKVSSQAKLIQDASDVLLHAKEIGDALSELSPLASKARRLQEEAFAAKYGAERDTPGFRQFHAEYMCDFPAGLMDAARDTEKLIAKMDEILLSPIVQASTTQSFLLVGPAGAGKTHALVSAAERRFPSGGYSLVVFGDDFGKSEPWEVLRSKLGLGSDVGRETLLECLQACSDNTGLPFVVAIDALNESPREARWKKKLPELLQQCRPYPGIKVCVSTRDTYCDLVVDAQFPGFAFDHAGFKGRELEALQAFATFYGLDAEITPLFADELTNPLFLHLACKTLKELGGGALDFSLPGFTSLFESHLRFCDQAVRARLCYANPTNVVRVAMLALADLLVNVDQAARSWSRCVDALRPIVGAEITPEALLKELQYESLIILTADANDDFAVRLSYQRYGDVLRAISLVESFTNEAGDIDVPRIGDHIRSLEDEDSGLLEVLSAVLPERGGCEITDRRLGLEPGRANRLFVASLPWRSRESIPGDIARHIHSALSTPNLWRDVYEAFFKLCLVPGHHLNAKRWLHSFLWRQNLTNRDAYLSLAAFKSYDADGAVKSLIDATLHADLGRWPEDSLRLAILALGWLTSCADRRVRDHAIKALARVLGYQPTLAVELAEAFDGCDDDYVLESVVLSIYSARLLGSGQPAAYVQALGTLISSTYDTPNVLVRDTVKLLASRLEGADMPADMKNMLAHYPTRVKCQEPWPTQSDAEPLLSLEDLPMNMKLWGDSLAPDFWRYVVESRVEEFDLKSAGITVENVASWIMVEALNLGYPGYKNVALEYDQALNSEFGSGRGRKGYAERLGKKYYWIALHRLLGVLADNVNPKKGYSDHSPGPNYLWSADVRKSDPTDVRDLGPAKLYPDDVLVGPRYSFPPKTTDIKEWVRAGDFTPHEACLVRVASDGTEWVALSLSARDQDKNDDDHSWETPYFSVDLFYSSVLAPDTSSKRGMPSSLPSVFDRQGVHCSRSYMAEYPDGQVFQQCVETGYTEVSAGEFVFTEVSLLRGGEWEYDYSAIPRQETLDVPCQAIVRALKLVWDKQRGWVGEDGMLAAFETKAKKRKGLFIRRDLLNLYLESAKVELLYRRFTNRGFIVQNGREGCQNDGFTYLRYEQDRAPIVLYERQKRFGC
jgi:hypothetical protein